MKYSACLIYPWEARWKRGKRFELSSESAGLVIIDMQVEGCERYGPGVKPVIATIQALLDRFRAVNGEIIHVQSVRTKDHPEFTVFGRPYGLLLGTPGVEFVQELKPLPGEIVVQNLSRLLLQNFDGSGSRTTTGCPTLATYAVNFNLGVQTL